MGSFVFLSKTALVFWLLTWSFLQPAWGGSPDLSGCLGREARALEKGWQEAPPQGDALLKLIDELGEHTLIHYSTREGIMGILERGVIFPNQKGWTHFTREGFSPQEVEAKIFLGMPAGRGKGDYVIILREKHGIELTPGPGKRFELREPGVHRFDPDDVLYAGPNPF